jgi:1-acyl-sn-glycerol-3-phosphate acyltransferase
VSVRFIFGFVVVLAYMVFVAIPGLLSGCIDPRRRLVLAITRLWARLILRCGGVRVRVEGTQNIPAGPAVFAANHTSALDIPVMFGALPADFRIIHKKSLYWTPIIGWYLYFGRHIGIDRKNAFRAKASLTAAAQRIGAGTSVMAFPEGTRSRDGRLQPFKRGSFVLAKDAGVPVVPVSLLGVRARAPRGLTRISPGVVTMRIHPAVSTANRDAEEVADEVRRIILRDCEESAA